MTQVPADGASSSPVATIIMFATAAFLAAGVYIVVGPLADQDLDPRITSTRFEERENDRELYVTLVGGQIVPLAESTLELTIDGVTDTFPMTVFAGQVGDG